LTLKYSLDYISKERHIIPAETAAKIAKMGLPTTHLISVGGWDAPHPDTSLTGHKTSSINEIVGVELLNTCLITA
jgi:hypothetical protein